MTAVATLSDRTMASDETLDPDETMGRRERKRRQMLDHLALTAQRLFAAAGYDAVTMEQIAAEAGVAKRTLYNHFPTKEAVLAHWMDQEFARERAKLRAGIYGRDGVAARLFWVLDSSAAWCEAHPGYMAAYIRHRFTIFAQDGAARPPCTESDITHVWRELVEAGQAAGELTGTLSADHLANGLHHLYFGAIMRWLTEPGLSLRDEFAVVVRLFMEGARPLPRSG
jgi:AcrR family transcriptional regulator